MFNKEQEQSSQESNQMNQMNQNSQQIYCQPGPNGQPIYYQIGPDGQPVFLQQPPQGAPGPQGIGNQAYYGVPGPQGYYQQGQRMPKPQPPKKRKKKRRFLLFFFELLFLLCLGVGLYGYATLNKIERVEIKDEEIKQEVKQQLSVKTVEKLQGYRNIALYGVDSRNADENGQSDTIIVCSINKDTKKVKLASVYRDSYLDCDGTFRKATDVYAAYGVERSIRMLNRNLDLDIEDFATVNMNIIADVVNAIGGIEIDVREDEVVHLNNYQNEGSEITGLEKIPIEGPGLQTLNGLQAMSYCRIRYTSPIDDERPGLDYERTIRQRRVLEKILEKVKTMDITKIVGLINEVFPKVSTSLSQTEILSLAKDITSYELVDTVGFPFDKITADTSAGDCVVPVNLANNVVQLHQFLFDEDDYQVSDTVQSISDAIGY